MKEKIAKTLKIIDFFAIASLLLLFISGLTLFVTGTNDKWVNLIFDDGYYYLGLVRSIVEQGSSFYLPPFLTNGYQPLWLMVLSASAFVFGTSDVSLAIQMFTLSFLFVGVFAYLTKVHYGHAFPAIAACATFAYVTLIGMETAMIPFFVMGLFSAKKWTSKGVVSSLLFLTRLDALALIVVNDGYRFIFKKEKDLRHHAILLPVVALYFLINYQVYGTPIPVSGLSKSVGNIFGENIGMYYFYIESLKPAFVLGLAYFIFYMLQGKRIKIQYLDEVCIALLSMVVISTYYGVFSGWPLWSWYFWPALIVYFYLLLSMVNYLKDSLGEKSFDWKRMAAVFMVFCAVLFTLKPAGYFTITSLMRHQDKIANSYGVKNIELANYIKRNDFAKETIFAMGDRAGSFGFFLGNGYQFFHTEGLVGPYAYYLQMKQDNGADYLRKTGAKYLIVEREKLLRSGDTLGVVEPVQGLSARVGPYMLCFKEDAIVFDQTYAGWVHTERYMFDMAKEVACPADLTRQFNSARSNYGALRELTFPSDYLQKRGMVKEFFHQILPMPLGF